MKTIFSGIKLVLAGACLTAMMGGAMAQEASATPGMIPHDISSYKITQEANACVMCHKKEGGMATNVPESHFKNTDGTVGDKVTAARYNCTACHAPAEPAK